MAMSTYVSPGVTIANDVAVDLDVDVTGMSMSRSLISR
jgi:hypothetical protein